MNIFDEYLNQSHGIIGDRTKDEMRYDKEVLRWLRKGKTINKAISKANKKYPKEALDIDNENMSEVAAHYDYLLEHEYIVNKVSH
jgi:hypothetical protein